MIMEASKWKYFKNSSTFGYTPNDLWMCFWPSKVHNLENFFELEMIITFLRGARLHFHEILMGSVCLKVFMDDLFCKLMMCQTKNYAIYTKYVMYHLGS
jgi:hypothetical protein